MLLDAFAANDTTKAIDLVKHSLREVGYLATVTALYEVPARQRQWQRQQGILTKALKKLSHEIGYDLFQLIQDTEESYAIVSSDPKLAGGVLQAEEYKHDPPITYTIALPETFGCPELVVSGMDPKAASQLIHQILDAQLFTGSLDLGEPFILPSQSKKPSKVLFKQFDPEHRVLLPLLNWYTSFEPTPTCQVLWEPFPWETTAKRQQLYWTCPFPSRIN